MTSSPSRLSLTIGSTEISTWHPTTNWTSTIPMNSIPPTSTSLSYLTDTLAAIILPILLVCGTFGNVMIVVVMRGMRSSQSTACLSVYFTALAVSDQCLLLLLSVWLWVNTVLSWPPSFFYGDLLCTIPYFAWFTSSLTSAWFLVAMTYQRVTSVVAPHRVGVLCTVRRGKMIIASIVVIAAVLNVHFLFTFSYDAELGQCLSLEKYVPFIDAFILLDLFLASLIPFLLLVVGNSILIKHVRSSMRLSLKMRVKGDKPSRSGLTKVYPMTVTLILTSTAFLILSLPTCVYDAYRRTIDYDDYGAMFVLVETVVDLLWLSVSASNFYLYLLSGSKFREETKRYLCCQKTNNAC